MTPHSGPASTSKPGALIAVMVAAIAIAALRVAVLAASPLNLGSDEAQYWVWSLTPDFGYFSKPPLIAWAIALSTAPFGDAEWAVRLFSPLFHSGAMVVMFLIGRRLAGERAGLWAAALYATVPGVAFAAGLITTDTPLLFLWAVALYALVRLKDGPSNGWAVILGLMLGLAFLSKYAALYFIVCIGVWAAITKDGRRTMMSAHGGLAFGVASIVAAPNILWNARHGWPTAAHTAANANWRGDLFHGQEALQFFGDQFGVAGPLVMIAFLWLGVQAARRGDDTDRLLIAMSAPVLVIGLAQAFISRANANWAAPAYVGAVLLVARHAARSDWIRRGAIASLALHLTVMIGLYAMAVRPLWADAVGFANAFKRVRGWDVSVKRAMATARLAGADVVISDDRLILAELFYYGRAGRIPVRAWDEDGTPKHHFEFAHAYAPVAGDRLILVTRDREPTAIFDRFGHSETLEAITVDTGRGKSRTLQLHLLEDPFF